MRAEGIEPSSHAWEAHIIPVYYARVSETASSATRRFLTVKLATSALASSPLPPPPLIRNDSALPVQLLH